MRLCCSGFNIRVQFAYMEWIYACTCVYAQNQLFANIKSVVATQMLVCVKLCAKQLWAQTWTVSTEMWIQGIKCHLVCTNLPNQVINDGCLGLWSLSFSTLIFDTYVDMYMIYTNAWTYMHIRRDCPGWTYTDTLGCEKCKTSCPKHQYLYGLCPGKWYVCKCACMHTYSYTHNT
jgi:hypothetical protein